MAKLRCKSFAERMFVPAFIFFFQMLYPFAWANDPRRGTAAAAGGCMLVRREALRDAGGLAAIRDALIDDCTLAKLLKRHGPISIALTERVHSIRAYPAIGDIRRMVSRTAYAQLRYSPLLLAGTVLGLALTYLAPVALAFFARGCAAIHRHLRLAADGLGVPAARCDSIGCRRCGRRCCRRLRRCIWRSRSIPPISMPAAAAACGRAARRPICRTSPTSRNCDE